MFFFQIFVLCLFSGFICFAFYFVCSVFFFVYFLPMYFVVYFLFVYNFIDHCHWEEAQLHFINISYKSYHISYI